GQTGQVALDQLGLEGLGGGGHDRPPPGGHDRDQVAERLADPGRGVDEQRDLGLEGLGDGGGHAPLDRPLGQARQGGEGGVEGHGPNLTGDGDIAVAPPTGDGYPPLGRLKKAIVPPTSAVWTATSSQPSSPQLSRICLVLWGSSGTVAYSQAVMALPPPRLGWRGGSRSAGAAGQELAALVLVE